MAEENKPAKTLAPGTIDQVRKNIGPIDPEEAKLMSQKLGGEVLRERAAVQEPISRPSPKRTSQGASSVRASGYSSSDVAERSKNTMTDSHKSSSGTNTAEKKKKPVEDLPEVSAKDLKLMEKLMMSSEYDIKPDYGLFNIFYRMSSKNREKVAKGFAEYTVKQHIAHMQTFISTIKTFIQVSPDVYKSKIATETDLKFKFLRTVGMWTMRDIKVLAIDVQDNAQDITVAQMIPFVRAVYHEFITIYYIGEQQIPAMIKEVYNDLIQLPGADQKKLQLLAKEGITEWLYIYNSILKGMYPLLMRMCSTEYVEFPRFFTAKIADILKFVGRTKFDLLLPDKKKKENKDDKKKKEEKKEKEEAKPVAGAYDDLVKTGINILDQLFPMAGFKNLEKHPDMFPYFQPLYRFEDGFNMLHPDNPMQVTLVLSRILEDFFQGCRNVDFNIKADERLASLSDNLTEAMNDWASYREDLFDRKLGDYLRNYVNSIYSQADYASTQYGKENLNNIFWRMKLYFLPCFKFNAPTLKHPTNDSKYKPFYSRIEYIRNVLTVIVRRIDENSNGKKPVLGVINPWNRYIFDLPNNISRRLDVLLGAKQDDEVTRATNANLIKYTLCVASVLDWWVNNSSSPAYSTNPDHVYRISAKDGGPEFSVPERSDQGQLFADGVKKAIAARKAAK
mgnify:CR=1 FL=1